jgi:hypothetical protein
VSDPIEPTEAERKREQLRKVKGKDKRVRSSLMPFPAAILNGLLNKLDIELREGCGHTLKHTEAYLTSRHVDLEPALDWLKEYGGACDCEILANVEAL